LFSYYVEIPEETVKVHNEEELSSSTLHKINQV
jgi:hypothetical protein